MATTQPLQFNDTTNKQGICQDIDFLVGTNSTSFPVLDKVRLVNLGLDSVADLIAEVDDNWAWEDLGQTDLPIGYMDTVASQQDYSISSSFLAIRGVYINTGGDIYRELPKVDRKTIMESYGTGLPTGYWIDGNSIYFDKAPATTTTGNQTTFAGYGFKVLFERDIIYIATDATTQTLGYSPQFYRLASLYACRDWAISNQPDRLNMLNNEIFKMEIRLKKNYGRRNKTQDKRFTVRQESNK